MGKSYEQYSALGRGDNTERTYLQLSLFPTIEEEEFSISDYDFQNLIRIGSNTDNARMRIIAEFSKNKGLENDIEFLKQIYHGGYGIKGEIDDFSAWYADDGIHVSRGTTARYSENAQVYSWSEAADKIRNMLDNATFATNVELDEAPGYERRQIAETLLFLYQDLSDEAKERHYLAPLERDRFLAFPEEREDIADKLRIPWFRENILAELTEFMRDYEADRDLLRFHFHKPKDLFDRIEELNIQRTVYPKLHDEIPEPSSFITDDEIDAALSGGSNVEGGRGRIYEYFTADHTAKEKADFLKEEYGTGGSTHSVSQAPSSQTDYNSKGIQFHKGNCTDIQMSWRGVAKRISELIGNDRYFTPEAKQQYEEKQRTQAFTGLYGEYHAVKEAHPYDIVMFQVGDFFEMFGDDAKIAAEMLEIRVTDRTIPNVGKVAMCGVPAFSLEQYTKKLRDKYTVTISAIDANTNERNIYTLLSVAEEAERTVTEEPIADEQLVIDDDNDETFDYTQYIGREIDVDDRKFVVETINELFNTVELRDITFQNDTGFPIFRSEKLEWLRYVIEQQDKVQGQPSIQNEIVGERMSTDASASNVGNFHITDDELGYGTASKKYAANVAAIRTLKRIEGESRFATLEEQEILSRYVGWGSLADCFNEKHSKYAELKSLLTDEEYEQARASTLNAHYTSPTVIKAMYKALENMGFKQGNILEPSCGIGNFMGLLPENMTNSKVYGVEIDSITGRIAQKLYPQNNISIQGFEETSFPDNFFDVAIGNVPFGNYKVSDRNYDKYNFYIHDYFFAKALDQVRPGGIIAFITSMGTLDKQNNSVRKYIAQRADLLGAVRLPNNAFLKNAGTQVTSDIIFLQKREKMIDIEPDWIHLGIGENGYKINQYFIDNPDMILGVMTEESSQYGKSLTCKPLANDNFENRLNAALENISAQITEYQFDDIPERDELSVPADPTIRNFSYTVIDDDIYFRENSVMIKQDLNVSAQNRIKGLIELRDCMRKLIEYETENYEDKYIEPLRNTLNKLYDDFTSKYGLINSNGNSRAFSEDSSYWLLCSLEKINDNGELESTADIFRKRTIRHKQIIESVNTSMDALAVSIEEKAYIDMPYMAELTGKSEDEIYRDLKGIIFLNPNYEHSNATEKKYINADEYLSGNVRKKLEVAKQMAELYPGDYTVNVEALERVQPKDLDASEISANLGATWIPTQDIEDFIFDFCDIYDYYRGKIKVHYSELTGNWEISNKNSVYNNLQINEVYGTSRVNALHIIEDSLNLKEVLIFDYKEENGKRIAVLNKNETVIAQQKQQMIKEKFSEWIWSDLERRTRLTKLYNERFNSCRPREYDGSHIQFVGINSEVKLMPHQVNAVARGLYGGNTLLSHVVGAGKTWTMAAIAMECKRLGLCNKSMFVVPNHLIEQWASEFLRLYPAANILVARKRDFETKNRKKFCARIATGDYDAIIIGHSQFEKIPMSTERRTMILQNELDNILDGIEEAKKNRDEHFTIKQLEKAKRTIKKKLESLNDTTRKDDVVTFEQLGVDKLFVDEAHNYKNLYLYTKMRNVGGIAQTEAQKSSDLFMKCQYLDEITDGKGVCFATGTPISNSMVELYTMQRYLQYNELCEMGMEQFDSWASTFGETVTAMELAPEGSGYRIKTRFAKFNNLPELMTMFKEFADVQTADMLRLPVPEAVYHNISVEPTDIQKEMVNALSKRADDVRNKIVPPEKDNMLKITNDGRKLALDQRVINSSLPDEPGTKVNVCVDNVYRIWEENKATKATQLVFCDLSTPSGEKGNADFDNVYDDMRRKLVQRGIPFDEICFIHDAKTDIAKKNLFAKVRNGDVRILFGSTQKMGAGTNVQERLIAIHDLDCPWRPSDLEQRRGRIVRQGNKNKEVHIYRYVTKNTFDAYMFQLIENKQKFISQVMTSKSPVRSAEDVDEMVLSYAELKALATANPYIKEKMSLDIEISKLKLIKSNFLTQRYALENKIAQSYPAKIKELENTIEGLQNDILALERHKSAGEFSPMIIMGKTYVEKKEAGIALLACCKNGKILSGNLEIGEYCGFKMYLSFDTLYKEYILTLQNSLKYKISLGSDIFGNIQRIDNKLLNMREYLRNYNLQLEEVKKEFDNAKIEVNKPFLQEEELSQKIQRVTELDALLSVDVKQQSSSEHRSLDSVISSAAKSKKDENTKEKSGFSERER